MSTPTQIAFARHLHDATEWSWEQLVEVNYDPEAVETGGDATLADMKRRAAAAFAVDGADGIEAFYLSALVLILEDFDRLWHALGHTVTTTPLPPLRAATRAYLEQDYGFDLRAPHEVHARILSATNDLVRQWHVWVTAASA